MRRDAWKKLRAKSTLPEQLEALELLHRTLLAEVQAHGRASAQFYQQSLQELGRVGQALIKARKRQILERTDDGDDN